MRLRRLLLLSVALVTALASCGQIGAPEPETPVSGEEVTEAPITDEEPGYMPTLPDLSPETGDGRFSLRYNKSATMNPLSSTDANNIQLAPLMYESLFILSENFEAVPVLCESYSTDDGINWVFNITPEILMSDGRALTAYDIKYSFGLAKNASRYKSRLKNISAFDVQNTTSVRVTLTKANYLLPELLDFAIVRDGNTGSIPPGTGPYRYDVSDGIPKLIANTISRGDNEAALDTIYLIECDDSSLGEYFTSLLIDLVVADPSGSLTAQIRRDHESRYYETTILQFLGFSKHSLAMLDSRVRRAISLAVNRSLIVDDYLGGRATAAPLALSPKSAYYDANWEPDYGGTERVILSQLLAEAGLGDYDNDTWLDYNTSGGFIPLKLTMIVSIENSARVYAARSIVETLRHIGLNVELLELTFAMYKSYLEAGNYDMFYGETRLQADFDLSELTLPGGSLNYGSMGGDEYRSVINRFLAAPGKSERMTAAEELCAYILEDVPFVPIAYLEYAVYTARGTIINMPLSPSGVFCKISDWEFAL